MSRPRLAGAAAALALVCAACGPSGAPEPPAAVQGTHAVFQLGIYLPAGEGDPQARLDELVREEAGYLSAAASHSASTPVPYVVRHMPPIAEYAPPGEEILKYKGRWLDEADRAALPRAKRALVMTFVSRTPQIVKVYRDGSRIAHRLAGELGGILWDEGTREPFSLGVFAERRLGDSETPLDVTRHFTIHSYRKGELIRMITLGMSRFGLPDVVVNRVAPNNVQSTGGLINLICQSLSEGRSLDAEGRLEVEIGSLRNRAVRTRLQESLLDGATGRAILKLVPAEPEEGDPRNRLLELALPESEEHRHVFHRQLLSEIFGSKDAIEYVDHDEALLAESARAREALLLLKPAVQKGFQPGEGLHVKAPFGTPDGGNEWMWVEVTRWEGGTLHGILDSEPRHVALKAGARVQVRQEEVFDYLHRRPDGKTVGNTTAELLMKERSR